MGILKRGKTKRLVLDIGTSAVKLCELSPTKSGYQLTKYLQREFAIEPAMDEDEKHEQKKEVIQGLLKEAKVRTKKTVVAVPGQSVFTRNRPLPPVPEHKVTQIVRYEIQQQIPFSLEQIALDYQVLDRTEAGGYEVMMAAIKVDVVEKQVEILQEIKKAVDIVDVSPLAAYNWLRHTGEFGEEGQCVALVDLGATTTDIVIQKDNQFKFTRSLHVGGNDITAAIASSFNMSFLEAEKLKRERGFAPTGDPARDGKGGEVIGRVLSRLVGEVNRSFSYFRSQPGGGQVVRVIITGGGACLRNIIPYLQRSLNIEVRIAQPLAGLAIAPAANDASEHPEQSCVALGLALRCCEDVPIEINLIPPIVLEVAKRKEQIFYWLLSLVTLYLILASIIPITVQRTKVTQDNIKSLRGILAQYDAELLADPSIRSKYLTELDTAKSDVEKFEKDVKRLDSLFEERQFWLDKLMEIWEARNLSLDKGTIAISSIQSVVLGGNENTGDVARAAAAAENQLDRPAAEAAPAPVQTGRGMQIGGGGMLGDAAGIAASRSRGKYPISGFPGLRPPGGSSGLGGGGYGFNSGNASRPNLNSGKATPYRPTEPNGFAVFGYADSLDAMKEFIHQLESREVFIKKGVLWHQTYTADVPITRLRSAENGASVSGASAGPRRKKKDNSTSFNVSISGGALSPFNATVEDDPTAPRVWEFRVDLQWLGTAVTHPDEV